MPDLLPVKRLMTEKQLYVFNVKRCFITLKVHAHILAFAVRLCHKGPFLRIIFVSVKVLRTAKKVKTRPNYALFVKTGGVKQANKDFRTLTSRVISNAQVSNKCIIL